MCFDSSNSSLCGLEHFLWIFQVLKISLISYIETVGISIFLHFVFAITLEPLHLQCWNFAHAPILLLSKEKFFFSKIFFSKKIFFFKNFFRKFFFSKFFFGPKITLKGKKIFSKIFKKISKNRFFCVFSRLRPPGTLKFWLLMHSGKTHFLTKWRHPTPTHLRVLALFTFFDFSQKRYVRSKKL